MFEYVWHRWLRRPYRLHVARSGNPDKPAVILLHGIAASGEDWRKILPYLERDFHCITIDLLGFGKSPKPQWLGYTMDDHMRALYHTLNTLHLGERFTLIGHSLGSLLASRYATEHEQNLERLVLLSPPVYPPLHSIKRRSARKLTGLLLTMYKFLRNDPRMTPETFQKLRYVAPLPRSILKKPDTWVPFMRTLKECIEQQAVIDDVARLSLPIDVCYGTLDQVVVGANVELLADRPNVATHRFINTHDLTKRYGKLLAQILA